MGCKIESLLDRVLTIPGIERGVGATSREIEEAEQQLGLKIPLDYRVVLRRAGWLAIGPQEIWGLGPGVPKHLHLVRSTQLWRTNQWLGLPGHLLPIKEDGGGNLFCLDCSHADRHECPVIFWDHDAEPDNRGNFWASTLSEFIEGYVDTFLAEELQ